jgi:hypothetical protein
MKRWQSGSSKHFDNKPFSSGTASAGEADRLLKIPKRVSDRVFIKYK